MMIAYIDEYRGRFGVEPICRTLGASLEGGVITSRGYRLAKRADQQAPEAFVIGFLLKNYARFTHTILASMVFVRCGTQPGARAGILVVTRSLDS